jgi:hypothetical protein
MLRSDQKRAIARKNRERWLKNAHDAAQAAKREVLSAQTAAYAAEKEAKLAVDRCAKALQMLFGVEVLIDSLAQADGVDLGDVGELAAKASRQAVRK